MLSQIDLGVGNHYYQHWGEAHYNNSPTYVRGPSLPSMLSQTDLGVASHCYQYWGMLTATRVLTNMKMIVADEHSELAGWDVKITQ